MALARSFFPSFTACQQPDYQTKDGKLYAIAANGTEVPFSIKGVNWFGMETSLAVPFGLWENQENGTTAVRTAMYLCFLVFFIVSLPPRRCSRKGSL